MAICSFDIEVADVSLVLKLEGQGGQPISTVTHLKVSHFQ